MKDETSNNPMIGGVRWFISIHPSFFFLHPLEEGAAHLHRLEEDPYSQREQQYHEQCPRRQCLQRWHQSVAGVERQEQPHVQKKEFQGEKPARHGATTSTVPCRLAEPCQPEIHREALRD